MYNLDDYLYKHQKTAISQKNKYNKCLINMWCSTGKTRTFTNSSDLDFLKKELGLKS